MCPSARHFTASAAVVLGRFSVCNCEVVEQGAAEILFELSKPSNL